MQNDRQARRIPVFTLLCALLAPFPASASDQTQIASGEPQEAATADGDGVAGSDTEEGNRRESRDEEARESAPFGVLPQLSTLLPISDTLRLRNPDAALPPEEPIEYPRRLPFGAQQAIDRGYALPKPFGVALIYVNNEQRQTIENLSVALGKGEEPPPDAELVDLPFVTLENVDSKTESIQLKADAWLLPNLNLFATIGEVEGDVDLIVAVDLDEFLPGPICPPADPCGTARIPFRSSVDATTISAGLTGVHAVGFWFGSLTAVRTVTLSSKRVSDVTSDSASARFGRRFMFGRGNILAPYFGVNYLSLDQEISGVTGLRDAFPDGDDLEVRFEADLSNDDKWAAAIGLNIGLVNALSFQGEFAWADDSQRGQLSMSYRF